MPYIGRSTDGFGVRNRFLYLASASDTSVSGADANGAILSFSDGAYVDVYLNGVLLKAGTDYNTNTANTIAGISSMSANDEVTVIVYDVFTVGDMVSATSGGTFVGNVAMSGTLGVTGATTTAAITASGIIKTDDTTDATSTTDGSLQTDGGLSVAKDVVIGDDLSLKSDSAALNFGADNDVTLTHLADKGLILDVGDQTTSNFGTANTSADNLVVGGTGAVGMSLLTDANNVARICFGDVDDTDRGQIAYNNSTHDLSMTANGESYIVFGQVDAIKISMSNFATFTLADDATVTITSGTPAGAMLVLLTVHSTGYANLFFVSWIGSEFNLTGDTNFAVSDTDGKQACVFSSGSQYQFTLKNTRGGDTVYTVGVLAA